MKALQFRTNNAQRIYDNYINRCKKTIRILSHEDQQECLMEVNSLIYEYLENNKTEDETGDLLTVLDRIGNPEETLKEVVAIKKTSQAVRSFNPRYIAESLVLNIGKGSYYIILSMLFLFSGVLFLLAVLKLFFPDRIGCYIGDGMFYFGFSDEIGVREVLGNWFIPVALATGSLLYYITIILLKLKNKRK